MKYLFIGGCADGRRIEVAEGMDGFRVAKTPAPANHRDQAVIGANSYDRRLVIQTDTYCRRAFIDSNGVKFPFFVVAGEESPISLLLASYRPGVELKALLPGSHSDEEHAKVLDYLKRGGRTEDAICIVPNIPEP